LSQPSNPAVSSESASSVSDTKQSRVACFIDGYNLYHAINWYEYGKTDEENRKYRKYKWLSLTELAKCYISPVSQQLVEVRYFTTFTTANSMKLLRHRLFVWAQECQGVKVAYGTFREALVQCQGTCEQWYSIQREKQTDVKIAVTMLEMARTNLYDKALIISGDADLIPAIDLIRKDKEVAVVVPIGRKGHDIESACGRNKFTMTEDHLKRCQLPAKLKHPTGKYILKPDEYK